MAGLFPVVDVSSRMPLAEGVLTMWRYVFDAQRLNQVWSQHRGRCYENLISFPTMTHLIADALLQYGGSGRRSFEKNIESGGLASSFQAAFGKLGRLPLPVSQALLAEGTVALRELFPAQSGRRLPASLQAFAVILIDGKTIKNVAKQLGPLRGVGGGMLGGKAVVALEWRTGLALAMQAHPDGDASEKRLVADLVTQLDERATSPRLFVADRGFADLVQAARFTARPDDHFVFRQHGGTQFTREESCPEQTGSDGHGRPYVQTWGWLGSASNPGRRYVRRIVLHRAAGEEDLILITDLRDAPVYPAADVLWLYQQRWGIERMFQKVTEVFGLKRLIGGRPQACLFQFAFCLLLYNSVELMTAYIAAAQACEVEAISKEKLFDDVHRELIAWDVLFTPEQTIVRFQAPLSAGQVQSRLQELWACVWSETWRQSPPRRNQPSVLRQTKRGHNCVHRLLQASKKPAMKAKKATQRC